MSTIRCSKLAIVLAIFSFVNVTWATGSATRERAPVFGKRVGDNTGPIHLINGSPIEESEEQQLDQLHQVVDTMTNLLNEQELQEQQLQPIQANPEASRVNLDSAPELMSESEIRLALRELEKVQQQEKQMATAPESRPQPVIASTASPLKPIAEPASSVQLKTESTYASQLDELAGELADEQLSLASQEAKRILKQEDKTEKEKITVVDRPTTTYRPQLDLQLANSNTSAPQPLPSPQSLYVGRLHSLTSELGPSLTDDFYSFHADQKLVQERPSASAQELESKEKRSNTFESAYPFNDLDSAAQTRNFRQEQASQQGFPPQPATFRFDVTSNRPSHAQSIPSTRPQLESFVDNLRTPPTTLVSSTENFWRPAQDNQQFNRHFNLNQHQLPKNKFHSIPPTPFPQAPIQPRQSDHVHFTGHSFVAAPSSQQFFLPQSNLQRDNRIFTTTSTPMISVLSGSDTSNGNSVSWDPPATINPPPAGSRVFSSIFPLGNQQLPELQTFFPPPPTRNQPALVFNQVPFHVRPDTNNSNNRAPQQKLQPPANVASNNRPEVSSTELDLEPPETSTYEQAQSTVTSTPKTILGASQFSVERETATSELKPSSRLLNNNLRVSFISHQSGLPVTSTASSILNSFARPSNIRNQQQATISPTTTTTTTTTTMSPQTTTNSTKKDDMVIYYYYYYDDNKNATIVAKNQTSRPPTLEEAIEADSGVEDTPYIEDSAPLDHVPRSKPQVTSTTTITPVSQPTTRKQAELALFKTTIRGIQPPSTLKPSFKKQPNVYQVEPLAMHNEERRINSEPAIRASQEAVGDQFSNPFTPTPLNSHPTTSFRPVGFNNRLPISSTTQEPITRLRLEITEVAPVSGSRISKQQIVEPSRNQLNQIAPKPNSASNSPSSISAPSSSSFSSGNNRASNANRYGTSNNNLFLESYGIDPSSTSSLSHGFSHADMSHQPKNWQAIQQGGLTQSLNKKSHPKPSVTLPERSVQKSEDNSQHFASQRQSNSRNIPSVAPKLNQPSAPRQVVTNQVVASAGRKLSQENAKPAEPNHGTQELDRGQLHGFTGIDKINAQLEDQVNGTRENLQRFNNNGRPSTMEGNTRNSFTRAPPHLSSAASFTASPISTTTVRRVVSTSSESTRTPSSPASVAQSTSGSTLSSIAQQSGSPPTVSFSQTESVSSSVSSSSEPSSYSLSSTDSSPITTTTTTTTQSSTSSTTEASPSSTESADRLTSLVTRRKFGNRNNRFQTRLDSISSASKSTTSTTTTPAPGSTSTTRRPLSSTTRRSSKQLFAGRRRLNSSQGSEASTTPANSTVPNISASTESSASTTTSRIKFGNSFTSKSRSSTSNPSESNNPVAARIAASSRSRLAFSRTTKPVPVASSTTESAPSVSETSTTVGSELLNSSSAVEADTRVSSTEKSIDGNPADETNEASPSNSIEDEPSDKREQSTSSSTSTSASTTTPTTTTTGPSSSPEVARAKPRVRPLFASRQKSSALFGNRRSSSTSTR